MEGEARTRLLSKGVIYEVKLLDWIDRTDIDADGNFLKTIIISSKDYQKPVDRDEVVVNVTASVVQSDPALL